ncbi:unnamed protein product [Rhizophagus irregularis]|nr:unnamed protein product [Rhizophagus irregularis]
MSASNYKQSNSSLASYEPSKPYPQLDGHSDSRRNIPEGRLAKDNVSETTIKPQDNTLPTIIVKAPLPSPIFSTFSFLATGPMYTKIYKNFSRTLSSNPRTAAQQKARFDRSCRRIFNSNKPKSGMALKLRYKIRLANQRKFLFCPYQKIYTRIPHLKFNMGLFKRFPTVPLFRFPYDRNCALLHLPEDRIFPPHISSALRSVIKNQDSDEEDNSSANNGRDDTSENSYRDWYIKNLIDEHYGKGASEYIDAVLLLQDSTIQLSLRDAYMLDIEDHNTSAKHYLRRTNAMEFFTRLNDNFDDRMASIRNFAYGASKKKSNDKRTVASRRLNNLITDFGQQYRDEHYPFKPYRAIIRPNDI